MRQTISKFDRFINIVQFLTRLKIKNNAPFDPDLGRGVVYFPIVGMIIGGILIFIYWILGVFQPLADHSLVMAICLVFSEVVITGGLHIDGLADTFDGIFSYRSKDRILEIMKDSRMGTNATLAVFFVLILKIAIIDAFLDIGVVWPIFMMPIMGRYLALLLTYRTIPARENGMGNIFIGMANKRTLVFASVFVVVTLVVVQIFFCYNIGGYLLNMENQRLGMWYLAFKILKVILLVLGPVILMNIFAHVIKSGVYRKIGGLTGDILGCSIEIGELAFILYIFMV